MMAGIKGRNTKPELVLRRALHRAGFRYRLHRRDLPGKPDLVLPRFGAVVFVHGCFWHRHRDCRFCTTPKSNAEFWLKKFEGNVARDAAAIESLCKSGWRVAIVWECSLRGVDLDQHLRTLADWLGGRNQLLELPVRAPPSKLSDRNLDSAAPARPC
ncbi:Very short patch repair protein [compost metagenome]